MSPDPHFKCSLRQSSDAHSTALAHAVVEGSDTPGHAVRLAVFGEGLLAGQSSNALALGLCEALAISGLAGEVFVAFYSGLSSATLRNPSPSTTRLRDVRGRSGPDMEELMKLAQPNVILIVAGGYDLTMHRSAMEVASELWELLQWTHAKAPETLVAAMAIPDGGRYAEQSSMLGPELTQRCRDANGHLASWLKGHGCHDGLAWIGASSLPCGPRSVAAGYWDGPLLSPKGAKVLAGRLICKLLPRLMRHQHRVEENAKGLPLDYSLDDGGEIPSLDAFLKAFSLEDEAEAKMGCDGETFGAPMAPPWEVSAAVVLQRQLRSLLGSKGKAQRLALARLRVRQQLSKTAMLRTVVRAKVTCWGVRLTAAD